ncbi:MAG: low molecular weight protein-tyrosine-phosphatase [Rhizobiaceae bacterium]
MNAKPSTSVLFVCLGNICRSPLAEGVFRHVAGEAGLADRFVIDSAGTGGWHEGSLPDRRSMAVAADYGIDLAGQRARKVRFDDFNRFDHILGMDRSNVADLRRAAPANAVASIGLFLEVATGDAAEIVDPYYGGPDGFETAYRTIREACELLAAKLA